MIPLAGDPGTVSVVGQPVSSWTLIVLLVGIVIGMFIRHKMLEGAGK